MNIFTSGYRGLSLLVELNYDRALSFGMLGGSLVFAAWVITQLPV